MNEKERDALIAVKANLHRIPEGQDPHAFREKVARALDSAPEGSRVRGIYKQALAEIDEELGVPEEVEEPSAEAPEEVPPGKKGPPKKRGRKPKKG